MNYNFNKLVNKNDDLGCGTYIVVIIFAIAIAFGISCLYAWIGMLLWNWVMPMIWVGAPVMTFWPMWGLMELCSILFKSHNFNTNNQD
jgi:hypothetical protein